MIEITANWRQRPKVSGLYVVLSEQLADDARARIRIGAGGNRRGKNGVQGRLAAHGHSRPSDPRNNTLRFRRWKPLWVWSLEGWDASEVNDAEHLLYRPFLLRFRRLSSDALDDSIFLVPADEDLRPVLAKVEDDLHAMAKLRF
jgi:hypothetical protein